MDELIPLRPVNTPSGGTGKEAPPVPEAPRPERPPERSPELLPERTGGSSGHSGKHHLDSHIHTIAPAPAPASAVAPSSHHQGHQGHQGHGQHGQHGLGHGHGGDLKAAKPTELLDQVNKDSIIDVQAEGSAAADPAIHRDEEDRDKVQCACSAMGMVPHSGSTPITRVPRVSILVAPRQ